MVPHMLATVEAAFEAVTPMLRTYAEQHQGKLILDIHGESGRQVLIKRGNRAKRLGVWIDNAEGNCIRVTTQIWEDTSAGRRVRTEHLTEGVRLPVLEELFLEIVRRGLQLLNTMEPPVAGDSV